MIEPVGTEDEFDSPYFLKNKAFCELWSNIAQDHDGKIRGKYSAWSFFIKGHFQVNGYIIQFYIKKATSSGWHAGITNHSKLKITKVNFGEKELFLLRKSLITFLIFLFPNYRTWRSNRKYYLRNLGASIEHSAFVRLLDENARFISDNKLYELQYNPQELAIIMSFSTLIDDVDKVLKLMFSFDKYDKS